MTITPSELSDFKRIYLKKYGIDLTDEEAIEISTKLLNFIRVVGKKLPKSEITTNKQ